jgi:hypothetical protein
MKYRWLCAQNMKSQKHSMNFVFAETFTSKINLKTHTHTHTAKFKDKCVLLLRKEFLLFFFPHSMYVNDLCSHGDNTHHFSTEILQFFSLKSVSCTFEIVLLFCTWKFREGFPYSLLLLSPHPYSPTQNLLPSTHTPWLSIISSPGIVQTLVGSFLCQSQQWLFLIFLFLKSHLERRCLL